MIDSTPLSCLEQFIGQLLVTEFVADFDFARLASSVLNFVPEKKVVSGTNRENLLQRGTLGSSEHHNIAKKFGKYRNTAKNHYIVNTATLLKLSGNAMSYRNYYSVRLKLRANKMKITIKSLKGH